ncbi:MAG: J domain-containing protein [Oligoflexia bacterium]|nr:J domain-containing protein [Oligoflexia bacterium]MBF0367634.1 J domain-containing protein [Oligoflexia bacterium]
MKDPYVVLGVSKSSTQDEIRKAYHNQAKKYHPDLNPGNKNAEAKFKELSLAYEQIGSEEERIKYDQGETVKEAHQKQYQERSSFFHKTQEGGGRYSFFFDQELEDRDEFYQMSIDFKDAILGAEREITLPHGKRLLVKIPAGVESGSKLRFKNQGSSGGDAYVEVTVRPLVGFKRIGNNIETEVAVSFIEALLGAEIKIPTMDGSVLLTIPPGVTTGSRLRIRGKGVKGSGDQIVLIKIVLPLKINPELQKSVREWGEKYSYNPREES